jgi:hypothetical protein
LSILLDNRVQDAYGSFGVFQIDMIVFYLNPSRTSSYVTHARATADNFLKNRGIIEKNEINDIIPRGAPVLCIDTNDSLPRLVGMCLGINKTQSPEYYCTSTYENKEELHDDEGRAIIIQSEVKRFGIFHALENIHSIINNEKELIDF